MLKISQPLLSICIPTYNHLDMLKKCLNYIFVACKGYENNIEIIISDNASTDGTKEYIESLRNSNLIYKQNSQNLGFNKNLFLLIDSYASGEYVWTIGDDDFISKDSISIFLSNYNKTDLFLFKYKLTSNDKIENEILKTRNNKVLETNYYDGIDKISDYGNIFATFMTCAIFRKDIIKNILKEKILENDWDHFEKVFPNGYLLSKAFSNNKVIYCEDFHIFIIPHDKEWDDKILKIQTKILPDFYRYLTRDKKVKKYLKRSRFLLVSQIIALLRSRKIFLLKALRIIISLGVINYFNESLSIKKNK